MGLCYTNFYTTFEGLIDYKGNHLFFQQDNASAHTVKKILRVFQFVRYFYRVMQFNLMKYQS